MEKQTFWVTETAGPVVAGKANPGAGVEMQLTAEQAAHPLRLGYLSETAPAKTSEGRKVKKD